MSDAKPKITVATIWLDGCSGCHMSFLDMDERLLALADRMTILYSPLVDTKDFPEMVDLSIVEGAVSNADDLAKIKKVRAHSKLLLALGDCAVSGNVPAMRNPFGVKAIMNAVYPANIKFEPLGAPPLLAQSKPVHTVVKVDVYVQGCPPSGDTIYNVIVDLLDGKDTPTTEYTRFGA